MTKLATNHKAINGDELEVGDTVDVPGGMHGTVKFIGEVKGKKGIFAGVELSKEWAARGKNDGDVEGTWYFTTSIPGSGIFLPASKAYKRASPVDSSDSFPPTPTTPSIATPSLGGRIETSLQTPPTPLISKLNQSVGPGRAASPAFKPKGRPSLPRPESPLRRAQKVSSTPTGRPSLNAPKFSKSTAATSTPNKFGGSLRGIPGDPGKRTRPLTGATPGRIPGSARPQSRSQSRLGLEPMFDEDLDNKPPGAVKPSNGAPATNPRSRPVSEQNDEVQRLKQELAAREKQLDEQAASLAEMEKSVIQLQSAIPRQAPDASASRTRGSGVDDADVSQLRALVREKNEKIAILTADFDAHRADFRSTIDTLELASTETERVYERRVEELTQEIRDLQDRGDDVESVAQQLKQLEELVQELEEGLEDARRGEAEARGEVEFLRGEVERGRSELKREREKAAAALKGPVTTMENGHGLSSREVEQRDDEIRGLKAIIHSLSRDAPSGSSSPKSGSRRVSKQRNSTLGQTDGANDDLLVEERRARENLEREIKELEGLVDRKTYREEELEREIERLRGLNKTADSESNGYNGPQSAPGSRRTGPENLSTWRQQASSKTRPHAVHLEATAEGDAHSTVTDASNLWCEICEVGGHDILTCTSMFSNQARNGNVDDMTKASPNSQRTGRDAVVEGLKGLGVSSPNPNGRNLPSNTGPVNPDTARSPAQAVPMPNPMNQDMVAGKSSGVVDPSKWCALCERDGHESVDCPFDGDF
ncbi:MAG: hypothetical protein LQ342_007477 [Letrouitia transgressa]|nr:MAG: hypothetical protein LQ342_007477 [Letrouitia transgressa]